MNAYQELQSSGIQWPDRAAQFLPLPHQAPPPLPPSPQQRDIFDDLERQMEEYASQYQAALDEVRKYYVLRTDSSIRDFLNAHRTIPQILLEAAPQLRAFFGTNTVFTLRASIDEARSGILYAVVMWPGPTQDARSALTTFDNQWWIARAGQAAGYLTFTYELV